MWVRGMPIVVGAAAITGCLQLAGAQGCDPVEVTKLLASDGEFREEFGRCVSISGDTAVIGAPLDDENGSRSGSAYVFLRDSGVWTQQAKLTASDGGANDDFGRAVSISGDTAVIGASSHNGSDFLSGAVYVFARSGGIWTQQAKLLPDDGASMDRFGSSVSISGDTIVVGATWDDDNGSNSGSAYVFTRANGVWTQNAKLLPDVGSENAIFGNSVALNGTTIVVGAEGATNNSVQSGAAYVFARSNGVWTQQALLLSSDADSGDYFGCSVSVDGDTAVIGAYQDDDNGSNSGSAYVFTRSGGGGSTWIRQAKLLSDDGDGLDYFGHSVSIVGDTVVAGAIGTGDNGFTSGSAYVFIRNSGAWAQQAKFIASDGQSADNFGYSVSTTEDTAITGAHFHDDNGPNTGAAYIFDLNCNTCPADLTGDAVVDTRDFVAFLNAWAAGETLADWDQNGLIDTRDFVAYLNDWVVGCP